MDTGGISSGYSSYLSSKAAASELDTHMKTKDYSKSSDEELLSACKEFEAYFLEQVFKEMQKTVDIFKGDESSPNGNLVDFFKDDMMQDLAATSTEKDGLGLAQTLFEQMKRNYGI